MTTHFQNLKLKLSRLDKKCQDTEPNKFLSGFMMDIKCFFGTIKSVLKSDGVVEGGTGEIERREQEKESTGV